ncbi:calpain-9-like [Pristis pectinata]|uniref:calpain-9-like n=1 Tax=Pristis pectinata TaxID=685728 RepID=UPI00223D6E21|nr:calpain-9-like [Pristis pectinata]
MGNSGSSDALHPSPTAPVAAPGSRDNPLIYRRQNFERIRSQCLRDGRLFEDPTFPAEEVSLGKIDKPGIEWLRPGELFTNPKFFVNSFSTTDIMQRELGDCWFLAAMSSLTLNADLFTYVVPSDQGFQDLYAGIFRFRFWQFGRWVEMVIDDRLPTLNGNLVFTCSSSGNELWSALLEKAYAKMHGSYSSLQGGMVSEAMEDFTGGIAFTIEMNSTKPKELWHLVKHGLNKQTMISCSIMVNNPKETEKDQGLGLLALHAYAIVDADKVRMPNSSVKLFRLRNPWGWKEYNGPWSDRSSTWKEVSEKEKTRLKLKISEDGEFWIPADILVANFTSVELCNHDPLCSHSTDCVWAITTHEGMWMSGISAGGNIGSELFSRNPQYRLTLLEEDEELHEGKPSCTISVQLMQKHGRKKEGSQYLHIAFYIFAVRSHHQNYSPKYEDWTSPFGRTFFRQHRPVFESGTYINTRAVSRRLQLPPGQYVIVPSTYNKNQEGEFFLRIFAKKNNVSRENGITVNTFKPEVNRVETDTGITIRSAPELLKDDNGPSSTLSAPEFMEFFNSAVPKRFHLSLETCCSLVFAVNDPGEQGWLTPQEAEQIMAQVHKLQEIFDHYAAADSGLMSSSDLRPALSRAGFGLNSRLHRALWLRHQTGGGLDFSNFVGCAVKLQKLFQTFERLKSAGRESRSVEEWLLLFIGI